MKRTVKCNQPIRKTLRRRKRSRRNRIKGGSDAKNILGGPLRSCSSSTEKTTGFYRDGFCHTGPTDHGTHVVCASMTDEFLQFSKSKGNDLITPTSSFPGLVAGDRWCLCAHRWYEAYKADKAPPVHLDSTHRAVLDIIPFDVLQSKQA